MNALRTIEELTVDDLTRFPVWQYTNSDERLGETIVRPVKNIPVRTLKGQVVGTQVRLADGSERWALLGNVDPSNPRLTQHFLTLSVFDHGSRFTMARYHDFDSDERGPEALAAFLGLPAVAVFPISYDIRPYCLGEPAALAGTIERQPRERLTRAQIIALAVP
jgi:hypothetical protein